MTDSAGHVDLETLAEVDEGIAAPQVEQAARGHLEGCADCREHLARLRTTRALLSALPTDAMPEAVRERVDAALERAANEPAGTIVPLARRGRWWASPAVAGGAAAAAVVVLIGALVAGNVIHHGGKTSETSSPLAGAARSDRNAAKVAALKEWSTGKDYTPASIPSLVPRLVTGTPSAKDKGSFGTEAGASGALASGKAPAPQAASPTPGVITQEQMRADLAAVLACGTILAGGVQTVPVAVDFARYNGKPAVIFALPAVGHPELLDVWVVRSTCSTSSLDVYFRRIPRP